MRAALVASFTAVASAASYEDVTVGYSGCGGSDDARVYYGSEVGPAISFAHGYSARGTRAYSDYSNFLAQVADAGYVVIVPESSDFPRECADLWKDQVKSLTWLRSSSLAPKVDYTKKTGVLGHSMGGGATYHTASQTEAITTENIGGAVAMNPQIQKLNLQPITNSQVPIMFTTGSNDTVIVPSDVVDAYQKTTSQAAKVLAEVEGGNHREPTQLGQQRLNEYVISFFDCHLKGDSSQCSKTYGTSDAALCGGKVRMTQCEHANEPSIEDVLV